MSDFQTAQLGFTPLSLRDVPLQKSTVEWADIGGNVCTYDKHDRIADARVRRTERN